MTRRRALDYLSAHHTLTLATAGPDGPWAAALFYANDAFVVYWLSDPASRHSLNIASDARAAVTIQEDYADWRAIQGLQMEGTVEDLGAVRSAKGPMRTYAAKYPFLENWRNPPPALAPALTGARVYRFTPSRVLFVDNSRGLGHREEIDPRGRRSGAPIRASMPRGRPARVLPRPRQSAKMQKTSHRR